MTGTAIIDVIKGLRSYLETQVAVIPYDSLQKWIYTAPDEEIQNKGAKYFITIYSDYAPDIQELGDSETESKVFIALRVGYRIDATDETGTEKQNADTFCHYVERHLRSQDFREYMGARGIKTPARHVLDCSPVEYESAHIGLRIYIIRMELWTYLSTTVT